MLSEDIKNLLNEDVRSWSESLTTEDLASILTNFYKLKKIKINIDTKEEFSANIGKKGEAFFETLCKQLPSNYVVSNTSKESFAGDFLIEYHYNDFVYKVIVDIKKYRSTVPKKEITKFLNNIKNIKNIPSITIPSVRI